MKLVIGKDSKVETLKKGVATQTKFPVVAVVENKSQLRIAMPRLSLSLNPVSAKDGASQTIVIQSEKQLNLLVGNLFDMAKARRLPSYAVITDQATHKKETAAAAAATTAKASDQATA